MTSSARRGLLVLLCVSASHRAQAVDFTFVIWSDTHFGAYPGSGYLDDAAQDIVNLPGTPYPPSIGGVVGPIEFILHSGDITESNEFSQYQNNDAFSNDDFISCINRWFTFPVYEIAGNHDSETEPGRTLIRQGIAARHGGTSYAVDHQGVHFIGLDGAPSSSQPFHDTALTFLEAHMPTIDPKRAVVIFNHYPCGDLSIVPWNRVYNAIKSHNVILLCQGHEHYPRTGVWQGFDYVITSDCKIVHGNQAFSVVRITNNRLTVIAYDWHNNRWYERQEWPNEKVILDKPITGVGPAIGVEPGMLSLKSTWGIVPTADVLTVTNTGGEVLHYSIEDDATWLEASPPQGSSSGEGDPITVTYTTASLDVGTHTATITISDPHAVNTPKTVVVTVVIKPIPGDMDTDGDVDQSDFGSFQACLSGAGIPQTAPSCEGARLDVDDDVDIQDLAIFLGCISGSHVDADPFCARP